MVFHFCISYGIPENLTLSQFRMRWRKALLRVAPQLIIKLNPCWFILGPKATAASQSGVISEPLKVGTVSRQPVTHIPELRGPGNALQTLASNLCSCPAVPHVNLDALGKRKEWAKWSRISGDSNKRQLVLSIYLHASVVPNWLPMS